MIHRSFSRRKHIWPKVQNLTWSMSQMCLFDQWPRYSAEFIFIITFIYFNFLLISKFWIPDFQSGLGTAYIRKCYQRAFSMLKLTRGECASESRAHIVLIDGEDGQVVLRLWGQSCQQCRGVRSIHHHLRSINNMTTMHAWSEFSECNYNYSRDNVL